MCYLNRTYRLLPTLAQLKPIFYSSWGTETRKPAEHFGSIEKRESVVTVSTVPVGNSRAAALLRRSFTRCRKPRTACSGVANTGMPASTRLRLCTAPVVSPIAQTSIGTRTVPRHAARAAIAA